MKEEKKMKAIDIRNKYLNYFKSHGHQVIPSASLIPENDPSVLFTTAGMQPLVPYLLGEKHPEGHRLTDYQKCLRTNDIDEVGISNKRIRNTSRQNFCNSIQRK